MSEHFDVAIFKMLPSDMVVILIELLYYRGHREVPSPKMII